MKAVRVHAPGGDEALRYEEIPDASPGPGQALVRVEASGVNFIDVYHRTGLYKVPLPVILGREGAGTVLEVARRRPRPRAGRPRGLGRRLRQLRREGRRPGGRSS